MAPTTRAAPKAAASRSSTRAHCRASGCACARTPSSTRACRTCRRARCGAARAARALAPRRIERAPCVGVGRVRLRGGGG
eukprot:5949337-Prymnesium_polylepis.1